MTRFELFRKALRKDLFNLHDLDYITYEQQQKLFKGTYWTGILNMLDPISPHAVTTEHECIYWWSKGRDYYNQILAIKEEENE